MLHARLMLYVMTMKTNKEAKKISRLYFHHLVNKREAYSHLMAILIIFLMTTIAALVVWCFQARERKKMCE